MASIGNLGLQGVTISPKFLYGINGSINLNLKVIEQNPKKMLYVAGHNIVLSELDGKN